MSFMVKSKTEDSVKCEVVDGGELKSRRHLNVRGKSATLPSITGWSLNFNCCHFYYFVNFSLSSSFLLFLVLPSRFFSHSLSIGLRGLEEQQINYFSWFTAEKDWDDIKFGVDNKVDFYAVSFVKDAQVVHELKNYLQSKLQFLYSFFRK